MNIIICDDSPKDREALIELLQNYAQERNECFEITEHDSGLRLSEDEASLQKCQLMFLDINMDDMDGLKTAMKIKDKYPKLPVVLVTAYALLYRYINRITNESVTILDKCSFYKFD